MTEREFETSMRPRGDEREDGEAVTSREGDARARDGREGA